MLKELAKSFLIYGFASSLAKFIGLFLVPVYTRIFSPEQYGVIDVVSTVTGVVCILGMAQLESAISRYYFYVKDDEERRSYVSTAFWTIAFLSGFWATVTFFTAGPISLLLFKTLEYRPVILVVALIIPVSNAFSFFTVLMRYLKKPVVFSIFVLIQLLSTVGISIWLVVFERIGVIGVFYGQLFGFGLGTVFMLIYLRALLRWTWEWSVLKTFLRYSVPMIPAVAGNLMNSYANRFVMLAYLSLADIGIYTVALKVASVFGLIDSAFRMAWGPFMWENFERAEHRDVYKRVMRIVTVCVFLLVCIIALFGNEVVALLATPEYMPAGRLVGMLAFSMALMVVVQTIGLGAGITKRTEYNTLIYFAGVAANIGCLFLLVPRVGLIAVPLCMLISATVLVCLAWYNSERLYYIGFPKTFFFSIYICTLLVVMIPALFEISTFIKLCLSGTTAIIIILLIVFRIRVNEAANIGAKLS